MKIFFRILKTLTSILVGIVVLFALVINTMHLFGYQEYIVTSGSMEPTIRVGSIVISDMNDTEPQVGEVVVFRANAHENSYVTHRIIEESIENTFITKGDANDKPDIVPLGKNMIIGTVVTSIPYAGYILEFLGIGNNYLIIVSYIVALWLLTVIMYEYLSHGEIKKELNGNE